MPEDEARRAVAWLALRVGHLPPLTGNEVRLFSGGEEFFEALLADIRAATRRVHLLFYIWEDEGIGVRLVEALEQAAARGVECRVLVDTVGSKWFMFSDLPGRLRAAGVKFAAALPVSLPRMLLERLDVRNHRKIAVVDGIVAYTGSQNVADPRPAGRGLSRTGVMIDSMARVRGPAAQALDVVFLCDWAVESDEDVADRFEEFLEPVDVRADGSVVQIVPSGPGPGPGAGAIRQAMLSLLHAARREIIMTTPYYVPDEATREALVSAALRGVATTIIIPRRHDAPIVAAAARAHYQDLLDAGVRVFHHQRGFLHAKTITVDASLGMLGSANFDVRSFVLNFEVSMLIYDSDLASMLRMMQISYLPDCEELIAEEWRARPVWHRLVEGAARLLGPLL